MAVPHKDKVTRKESQLQSDMQGGNGTNEKLALQTDKDVRERLALRGCKALNDAELLSIIIREGNDGRQAVELAGELLQKVDGSLGRLSSMEFHALRSMCSLAARRAAPLAAAFELARRMKREQTGTVDMIFCNEDVEEMFRSVISELPHEEFWVVYLASSNRVLERMKVSQGGVSSTVVDCKLLIKRALDLLASSMILVHNHPSGDPGPSGEDITITKRLDEAATLFDIRLLDHVIFAGTQSYSFRCNGLL